MTAAVLHRRVADLELRHSPPPLHTVYKHAEEQVCTAAAVWLQWGGGLVVLERVLPRAFLQSANSIVAG
jgi:hypothetical protein